MGCPWRRTLHPPPLTRPSPVLPPHLQGDMCAKFKVHGYPTMKLALAADLAAIALDKLTAVNPASRHANSVIAFLEQQLDA